MYLKATSKESALLKVKRKLFSTTSCRGSNRRLLIKQCEMGWPCMSTTSKLFFPVLMTRLSHHCLKLVLLMNLYTKLNSKRKKTLTCWEFRTKSCLAIFQMTTIPSSILMGRLCHCLTWKVTQCPLLASVKKFNLWTWIKIRTRFQKDNQICSNKNLCFNKRILLIKINLRIANLSTTTW